MNKSVFKFCLSAMVTVALCGSHLLKANNLNLEYISEWQTDFSEAAEWVNLLKLSADVSISESVNLQATTISVATTCDGSILDDLQVFSNIQEDNLPLTFAVLGASFGFANSSCFFGLRNVNEDYFTTPFTSLFTNSSCGIFPTLSYNYELANYPLASWCVHYTLELQDLKFQTSVYNGRGYKRITGHDNIFKFSPSQDGIMSLTSLDYTHNGSNYNLGCAVYYGMCAGDEALVETLSSAPQDKTLSFTPWAYAEQRLSDKTRLMLQGSLSTVSAGCRYYAGAGLSYTIRDIDVAIFSNYAHYTDDFENASEITCSIPLFESLKLQPALHVINTNSSVRVAGLFRLCIEL